MKEWTCIVIGGGYAGINAVKAIRKTFKGQASKRTLRLSATVTKIESGEKRLLCQDAVGNKNSIKYDFLDLAVGSVVRQPDPDQGGMALASLDAAWKIREAWRANIRKAVTEKSAKERQRLMTIAVVGAGISGIETSAELAYFIREDAALWGLIDDVDG